MSTSREKMQQARELIQAKRYDEARAILRGINHDMALDWLDKIDKLDPPKSVDPIEEPPLESFVRPQIAQMSSYATAPTKSYTNAAVIVLILYFVLWLPGFIANSMYLSEANQAEKETGKQLPGVQALRNERWIFGYIPIILVALFILLAIVLGPSISQANDAIYRNIVSGL